MPWLPHSFIKSERNVSSGNSLIDVIGYLGSADTSFGCISIIPVCFVTNRLAFPVITSKYCDYERVGVPGCLLPTIKYIYL
jgi:hypothetical protein